MLFGETVAVYCETHTKHTDTEGSKKCTHSLSAAIKPDTLTAVFAQQFDGIDAV
jgi:hypothetical protein